MIVTTTLATSTKWGTYTVSESKYTLTVDDKSTEHVAGEKLSFTADEKDGYTFTGWKVTGLPTDVDTTKATISFTMPANNVTLKAQYTENAPETYELKVHRCKGHLKDGGTVADLKAVPVGDRARCHRTREGRLHLHRLGSDRSAH